MSALIDAYVAGIAIDNALQTMKAARIAAKTVHEKDQIEARVAEFMGMQAMVNRRMLKEFDAYIENLRSMEQFPDAKG